MKKDDFQDSAKSGAGKDTSGKQGAAVTPPQAQMRPVPMGPRPPAPRAPFGMPQMPVAMNVRPLPMVVKAVAEDKDKTQPRDKDEK